MPATAYDPQMGPTKQNPKGKYPQRHADSAREALNNYLSERKLTHVQAAKPEHLGFSTAMISEVSTGKRKMQMQMALRLRELLGVTLDDIMDHGGRRGPKALTHEEAEEMIERKLQQRDDIVKGSRVTQLKARR